MIEMFGADEDERDANPWYQRFLNLQRLVGWFIGYLPRQFCGVLVVFCAVIFPRARDFGCLPWFCNHVTSESLEMNLFWECSLSLPTVADPYRQNCK